MFTKNKKNGTIWTMREDVEDSILDNLFHKLNNYEKYPELTLLKDNNVRSAFLFSTGRSVHPEVFIKLYKRRGLKDILKHIFVPSKAVSEWRILRKLEDKNLPCPRPFAFSEKRSFRVLKDSCLIAEALTSAVPLNKHVENMPAGHQKKRELTKSLAFLISKLHRSGIFYRDLHAGNILIRSTDNGSAELFLIDLHRAAVLPGLLQWMRVRDLAQLCNSLRASKADRLRFMKEYCNEETVSKNSFCTLQKKIYNKSLKLEKRRIKSRSKRCLKNSSVFEKSKTWDETYFGRRDFGREAAKKAVSLHSSHGKTDSDSNIKTSSKSVLTIRKLNNGFQLCTKGYRFLGTVYSAKNLFRKSRAIKSWIAANGLLVRGIQTPVPHATVEKKWGPFIIESFFITQWLPDVSELNSYIQESASKQRKEAFIKACAQAVRKLHAQGIYHADLKSNNILVTEKETDSWGFYFVDLDRVSFKENLTFYQRAKNLAQINASVSSLITVKDRLKFFRFYAKGTPLFSERKRYYRKILEISSTKITKPYGITFKHENSSHLQ